MTHWHVPVVLASVAVGTALGLVFQLGDAPERLVVPALVALLALTFAGVAFPDRPLVVVALVVGPLVELPVLAVTANRLLRARR